MLAYYQRMAWHWLMLFMKPKSRAPCNTLVVRIFICHKILKLSFRGLLTHCSDVSDVTYDSLAVGRFIATTRSVK